MRDIEKKAMALLNASEKKMGLYKTKKPPYELPSYVALYLSIEQHEAFKQEVSDALMDSWYHNASGETLERFIIPKPKPDPLVEVMRRLGWYNADTDAADLRVTLGDFGLEIREKNDD